MRRPVLAALAGGAAVLGILAAVRLSREEAPTAPAMREDVRLTIEATGSLEAAVAQEIGPPSVDGFWDYNLAWMIPEGTRVKAGDVVARFDATEIEDRLREHRATLETTTQQREKEEKNLALQIEQLRLDVVKAKGDLAELDVALDVPEGLLSSIDIEQKKLAKALAQERVRFLEEKVVFERQLVKTKLELLDVKRRDAEGKIAYDEAARDKFAVKASVAGLVVQVPKMRGGDRWEVGESVWMLAKILRVADTSTLRVEASLLEKDAARVQVGQAVDVAVDAMPGVVLRGKVAEVGGIVREKSQQDATKVIDVIVPLDGADLSQLRPGMGVRVTIETRRLPAQVTVPLVAIVATDDGTFVDVAKDGALTRRRVTLGERTRDRVIVVDGLSEGERVALPQGSA